MSLVAKSSRLAVLALGVAAFGPSGTPAYAIEPAPTFNVEWISTLAGGATAVAVDGNYAYVARGAAGLAVVNRSNPATPVVVATILPGDGAPVYIRDCAVRDGVVYLVNWDDVENGATGLFTGVYAYDVSVPSAPVEVSRIDWGTERFYHQAAMVYDLAIAEVAGTPYAFFVSEITNDVEVFDISNPAAPAYAASLVRPSTVGGVCEDVAVVGDTAYVAWLQGGISSYDVSDLAAIAANNAVAMDWGDVRYPPVLMTHKGAIGNARGIAATADGLTLVVTDAYTNGKLRVFDMSNPLVAVPVGTFQPGTSASPLGVAIAGDRAFAAWGADGVRVIDLSNPTAPTQIARYDTANAKRCTLAGSAILLADGTQGTLTLGLRDDVTIVSATWSRSHKRLTVTATSTAGGAIPAAVLTVTGRGTMTYGGTTGLYTFTQSSVYSRPSSVTVTSTWGDAATLSVAQIR